MNSLYLINPLCQIKIPSAFLPSGIMVHPDRALLSLSGGGCSTIISARLVLDCMGHASPVVKQLR